jgi:hypothetical protein
MKSSHIPHSSQGEVMKNRMVVALSFVCLFVVFPWIGCERSSNPSETQAVASQTASAATVDVVFKNRVSGGEVNAIIAQLAATHSFAVELLPADVQVQGFAAILPEDVAAQLKSDPHVSMVIAAQTGAASGKKCAAGCQPHHLCGCICPGQFCWF